MADRGLDGLKYTPEEAGQWKLDMLKAMGPQSIARRFIALAVTGLWCGLIIVGIILKLWGGEGQAIFIFNILNEVVAIPFSIVLGFYFLANVVRANK